MPRMVRGEFMGWSSGDCGSLYGSIRGGQFRLREYPREVCNVVIFRRFGVVTPGSATQGLRASAGSGFAPWAASCRRFAAKGYGPSLMLVTGWTSQIVGM